MADHHRDAADATTSVGGRDDAGHAGGPDPVPEADDAGAEASGAEAPVLRLPALVLPRRLAGDAAIIDEWPAPRGFRTQPAASGSRWLRWLRTRAAVIALAAATGGLVGAVAVAGMGWFAARDDGPGAEEAVEALRNSIGQLAHEIKALRDGVGAAGRTAADGLASLEDRLAGAEAAQARLADRVAGLSEGLSRDRGATPAQVSPETTGSIGRGDLPVATDWVLWRVRNGRALVQGNGGYFEVVSGSQLPGLGLVQRIVKQDGRWVVLTRNGVIVARG